MKNLIETIISILTIIKKGNLFYTGVIKKQIPGFSNRQLIILGNGSSLVDDLSDLSGNDSVISVVNAHVLSESFVKLKPAFYTLMDDYFLKNEKGLSIVNTINELTTWNMYLIIPRQKRWIDLIKSKVVNPNIKIVPINDYPAKGYEWFKDFLYKRNLSMPRTQNVMVAAIYCGIMLGFKQIKLYGVEHSWTKYLSVDDENDVCIYDPHFYDENDVKPIKWAKDNNGESVKFSVVLQKYARMFESYWELKRFADKQGVKIYNCTKGSFIDAFDRRNLK